MLHPELPQNLEAERAALGALIMNRDAILMVADWLTPDQFYLERHGQIYAAIAHLYHARTPPDIRTIADELRRRDQLDTIGGISYLSDLTDATPTSYHIEDYAREVERCATLRRLITAGGQIASLGYNERQTTDEAIGQAQQLLSTIGLATSASKLVPLSDLIDREYQRMVVAANTDGPRMVGTRTGFRDLDELTSGLQDQDVILLAARPSVGKSALMMCMAYGVATGGDRDVLVFSLEMSSDQLTQRLAAMRAQIDSSRVRTLYMSEADSGHFMAALSDLSTRPIFIDDTAAVSVAYVRTVAHRHIARHGRPIVLFVDYLQLMTAPGYKPDDRVQIVSSISRDLKALAKELRCPVVALCQLSRASESRSDHRPILADLRESGGLEQDADIVLMLYRDELYDADTDAKGIAELLIRKHRNGPIGVVPLRFDAATTRFDTLTYRSPEGY